jgi:hypothetical protein
VEVTHGAAGWHPHVHAVLFFDRPVDLVVHAALLVELRARWARVAGVPVHAEHALDLRAVTDPDAALSAYVAGWSTGAEVTRGDVKQGRGTRTPMQLLEDAAEGDQGAWRAFHEYVLASKGRRMMVWSRGLRARLLGDDHGPSDDQVAAETTPDAVVVAHVDRTAWTAILGAGAVAALLDHLEAHGTRGLPDVLRRWGLPLRVDYRSGPDGAPVIRGG